MLDFLQLISEAKFDLEQLFRDLNTSKEPKGSMPVSKSEIARIARKKAEELNKKKPEVARTKPFKA